MTPAKNSFHPILVCRFRFGSVTAVSAGIVHRLPILILGIPFRCQWWRKRQIKFRRKPIKRASQPNVEIIHQNCISDGVVVGRVCQHRIKVVAQSRGYRRTLNNMWTRLAKYPGAKSVDGHPDFFQTDLVAARKVS